MIDFYLTAFQNTRHYSHHSSYYSTFTCKKKNLRFSLLFKLSKRDNFRTPKDCIKCRFIIVSVHAKNVIISC